MPKRFCRAPTIVNTGWRQRYGRATSAKRIGWQPSYALAPCGLTAITSSTLRCPSVDTSNPGGDARWGTRQLTSTPRRKRSARNCRRRLLRSPQEKERKKDGEIRRPFYVWLPPRELPFHQQDFFGVVNFV